MGKYRMNKAPRMAFLPDITRLSHFAQVIDKETDREETRYLDAVARGPNI